MHFYTVEQKIFVEKNIKGKQQLQLLNLFNEQFGTDIKITQLRAFIKNNGFTSGLNATFKPGSIPFNKGIKKYWTGGEESQFKTGHKPHNYKPVGTERVNADDYVDIKIADPNKWKGKHILTWEDLNGPVTKGCVVIFGDGDRRNFDPNNLIQVSRKQLVMLNKMHLIQNNADLTRTGVIVADIYQKLSDRKKCE
jgi:hypothetical protein